MELEDWPTTSTNVNDHYDPDNPTAHVRTDDHGPENATDGDKDTYFALQGAIAAGYWQSKFVGDKRITRVEVTSAHERENEGSEACIYIGDKKVGSLPVEVEKSKVYAFPCEADGHFVKIVTGRSDGKLAFANVEVWSNNLHLKFGLNDEPIDPRKYKYMHPERNENAKSRTNYNVCSGRPRITKEELKTWNQFHSLPDLTSKPSKSESFIPVPGNFEYPTRISGTDITELPEPKFYT